MQIEHCGLIIKIEQDKYAPNPRKEFDNFGTMVCFHKRYDLGDFDRKNSPPFDHTDFGGWDEMEEHIVNKLGGKAILPLYLYDHSGITMSTGRFSCPWDSGQVGFIYATLEDARKNWNLPKATWKTKMDDWMNKGKKITLLDAAKRLMEGEVKEYDQYLTGDVWGYTVEDQDGEHLDSCWGFFGEEYCLSEAKSSAEHYAKKLQNIKDETQIAECVP